MSEPTLRRRFTEPEILALIGRWHAGEPEPALCAEAGLRPGRIAWWAWARNLRKRDNPEALYAARGAPLTLPPPAGAQMAVPTVNPGAAWRPHGGQTPPDEPWRTWVFMGGRGAGKTRAGAEWLADLARPGARLALVGPTLHDVRQVMIDGPSGLRNLPGRERPVYQPTRRVLSWSNGAEAHAFSAEDPDSLRGPQFAAAWADEFCTWPKPGETLSTLRLGLRVGDDPRLAVTTTPRPTPALRALLAEPGCRLTRAATEDNPHLAPAFLESVEAVYGGTRLAAQELRGELLEAEGALWRRDELDRCRGARPPRFDAVAVGVDPPISSAGDACGIVAVGRLGDRAYVLEDRSAAGLSPNGWAAVVVEAARRWEAAAIVAEANQGGDMVRAVLAAAAPAARIRLVHASRAKRARAEPVAALYEQGRVTHCGPFPALEEELMTLGAEGGERGASPDRADALVWAVTALMLEPSAAAPRIRVL